MKAEKAAVAAAAAGRRVAVPEAPRGEIRRRGVPVLPPRPAAAALPQLRSRAALPLHLRLPVLLLLGVRRRRRPGAQPHRAGAPGGALALRRRVILRRDGLRCRLREAKGEGLGVGAVLEVLCQGRGRGGGGGRGGEAGAGEVQLGLRDGRGGEGGGGQGGGDQGAVGVALPEPHEGVPAPEVVGEHAGAGV
ncbi:hypothetical protein CFC21_088800, partial [Triticum aestivum]